ncbi:MAG: hypothetical protein U1E77_08000 [Inhella sp.]
MKRGLCVMVAAALAGGAWAQSDGKISDSERAKRDAEKVFSFIKFHTVKPAAAAAPAKPAPTAAKPTAAPAPRPSSGGSQVATASSGSSPNAPAAASEPVITRSLEPAAPPPQTSTQPVAAPVNTLPPAASLPPTATPDPEPEVEAEEVPLKLEQYVAPEMTRQVLEAIGGRDHVVPVRFTVEPNGVVSKAEPREGGNRRLGLAAARAVQQWRFGPLPERRVVDVELMFRAPTE